jgi:hypothetical protein
MVLIMSAEARRSIAQPEIKPPSPPETDRAGAFLWETTMTAIPIAGEMLRHSCAARDDE